MDTKALLLKSLITQKLQWREKVLAAHGDDQRNHSAVALLKNLLNESDNVSTDALAGFKEFELRRACNDVCHKLGFKYFCGSLADFVDAVARKASEQRAEIAKIWGPAR
jgi:hypothetical protein